MKAEPRRKLCVGIAREGIVRIPMMYTRITSGSGRTSWPKAPSRRVAYVHGTLRPRYTHSWLRRACTPRICSKRAKPMSEVSESRKHTHLHKYDRALNSVNVKVKLMHRQGEMLMQVSMKMQGKFYTMHTRRVEK